MPGFDVTIGDYTLVPNPFWGGVAASRCVVFGVPLPLAVARAPRRRGDHGSHNLLDRPRDAPLRTAIGIGVADLGVPRLPRRARADRVDVFFGLAYVPQIWAYRVLVFVGAGRRGAARLPRLHRAAARRAGRARAQARRAARAGPRLMLTVLEETLAEAHGLAIAASETVDRVAERVHDTGLRGYWTSCGSTRARCAAAVWRSSGASARSRPPSSSLARTASRPEAVRPRRTRGSRRARARARRGASSRWARPARLRPGRGSARLPPAKGLAALAAWGLETQRRHLELVLEGASCWPGFFSPARRTGARSA